MSPNKNTQQPNSPTIAPEFDSVEMFLAGINAAGYARYNYGKLLSREGQFKEMIPGAADVALLNSGAAAMHTAIEAEGLSTGDIILCSTAMYGTSKARLDALGRYGIRVEKFDPADMGSLKQVAASMRPKLIIVESVANTKEMPLIDIAALAVIAEESGASLIIDNTLPSPHLLNPLQMLKGTKASHVIVESGTKHYQDGKNEITLGLAYSSDLAKIQEIKRKRIDMGTYLQPGDEARIPSTIAETMPATMKNHARNGLVLAKALQSLPGFVVAHPNLQSHPQHDLANTLAPDGIATLFYVTIPEGDTGAAFMQRIKNAGEDQIGLGSSFGHPKTWLSNYQLDERTVRIAVGSESEREFDQVVKLFQDHALKK
jgi:cystathionine beta-lyase/cystathionine gamma-synthase